MINNGRLKEIIFRILKLKNGHSSYLNKLKKYKAYDIWDAGPTAGTYKGYIPMFPKQNIYKLSNYVFDSKTKDIVFFSDMGPEGPEYIGFSRNEYGKTWIIAPTKKV